MAHILGTNAENNFAVLNLQDVLNNGVTGKRKVVLQTQGFTFTCGPQLNTFFVTLTNGQFVDITCGGGALVVRVGCGNTFAQRIAIYNLQIGQAVQVNCLRCQVDDESFEDLL